MFRDIFCSNERLSKKLGLAVREQMFKMKHFLKFEFNSINFLNSAMGRASQKCILGNQSIFIYQVT